MHDATFWEGAWLLAITLAVVKLQQLATPFGSINTADFDSEIASLMDVRTTTITDLFALVLSLTAGQYFKAQRDFVRILGPAFRDIRRSIVAFVDNVDEYFNAHIQATHNASAGETDKAFWYLAQMGLASAIRHLHGINNHVKVFASVRTEAFTRLLSESPIRQQLEGSTLRLDYELDDLREIFVKNLEAEPRVNCVKPQSDNPFERFFGEANLKIPHLRVGESEDIWDYIRTHTLGRPRDLMTIGSKLSNLRPGLRTRETIRRAVNEGSTEIAAAYLSEITLHLAEPVDYRRLFGLIDQNIMTRRRVAAMAKRYNTLPSGAPRSSPAHVFCSLHKSGLLGYVAQDVGVGERVQRFERPGEQLFSADHLLPPSTHYIVHPVLDANIRSLSPAYLKGMDTLNIAGDGRRWRRPGREYAVVIADCVNASVPLTDTERSRTFTPDLAAIVTASCGALEKAHVEGGDKVVLVDRNAANLIAAIREIARRMRSSQYGLLMRAGAEFGLADTGGTAYRTAARMEEASRGGWLCATQEFADALRLIDDTQAPVESAVADLMIGRARRGSAYNISKGPSDPDLWKEVVVFRLDGV
jgi:hypothetical protein